ncbi:MAG TPA: hypothetical protein VFC80_07720 [Sphaerochaeta sp.]|nr:hypothetical protein [Sphaerochaeta sp.]
MARLLILLASGATLSYIFSHLLLLRAKHSGAVVKEELQAVQKEKEGTPLIGGVVFVLATILVSLFDPQLSDPALYIPLVAMVLFSTIGYIDDRTKQRRNSSDGITTQSKFLLQALAAIIILLLAAQAGVLTTTLALGPFSMNLHAGYYLFAFCYLLYFVNAVNIVDGLDSLAAGASLPLLLLVVATAFSRLTPTSTALLGAVVIFLLFNKYPARYFMGDLGSHALGAYIGISALIMGIELMIFLAGGIFLVELASSLIQIISIRRFGRKVFTIAPLHHAYELQGVGETTIVRRFVLISWICGVLSLLILW